jgi:hypothetical protein
MNNEITVNWVLSYLKDKVGLDLDQEVTNQMVVDWAKFVEATAEQEKKEIKASMIDDKFFITGDQ